MILLLLALFGTARASARDGGAKAAPTILVSFDGMRADYLTSRRASTPAFDAVARAGVHLTGGMTPAFVSKTFPNHWTLVTGLHEESHGIVGNRMRDPAYPGEAFGMGTTAGKWWDEAEPLWSAVERQGGRAAVAFWPGSAATGVAHPPSLTLGAFNRSLPFPARVQAVLAWLALPAAERPDLVCLYFEEPDSTGHDYGPGSAEVTAAIAKADATLGLLLAGLEAAGLWGDGEGGAAAAAAGDGVNLVVVADHGMAATSEARVVTLGDWVDPARFTTADSNPVASIWPADAADAPAIAAALRVAPHLSVFERHEIPERWHYRNNRRAAPVLAVADEGWSIRRTNATSARAFCCGTHGYDNALPSMRPIFLARGPAFRRGIAPPGPFDNVHVQPLLAHVVGLVPELMPPVNGSLGAVRALLLDSKDARGQGWRKPGGGGSGANENGVWLPSMRTLSLAPVDGANFLAGSVVDVLVTVPAAVSAAEAAAAAAAAPPTGAPLRETPVDITVDGVDILVFCASGRAATTAAVPPARLPVVFSDASGTTHTAAAAAAAAGTPTPVLFQSTLVRRCVMPTLATGETTRAVRVVASVPVASAGGGEGRFGGTGAVEVAATWTVRAPPPGGARNAILFIGDGMSLPMISAGRSALGASTQLHGKLTRTFPTDSFEELGLVHTNSLEALVTDSFASASAYNSGHKAVDGAGGVYPDATADPMDNPRVETLAEYVRRRDPSWGVGAVTTAHLADATPAAVWGHSGDRGQLASLAAMSLQLPGGPPQVLLGGGREHWAGLLPEFEQLGYRTAGNASSLCAAADCTFGKDGRGSGSGGGGGGGGGGSSSGSGGSAGGATPDGLIGLFAEGTMATYLDRNVPSLRAAAAAAAGAAEDPAWEQPGLAQMASAALSVLARHTASHPNRPGFLLMVEAASIDKQAHSCDTQRMLGDLLELQQTIGAVAAWCAEHAPDTAIVVTSDHATGGFDVYGSVDTDAFRAASLNGSSAEGSETFAHEAQLAAISTYGNSRWPDYADADGDGMVDNWDGLAPGGAQHTLAGSNVNHPAYSENYQLKMAPAWLKNASMRDRIAGVPLAQNLPPQEHEVKYSAVHTSSDVMVFATGPGAAFFGRSLDNTEIFFGLAAAIGAATDLGGKAAAPAPAPGGGGDVIAGVGSDGVFGWVVLSALLVAYGGCVSMYALRLRGEQKVMAAHVRRGGGGGGGGGGCGGGDGSGQDRSGDGGDDYGGPGLCEAAFNRCGVLLRGGARQHQNLGPTRTMRIGSDDGARVGLALANREDSKDAPHFVRTQYDLQGAELSVRTVQGSAALL
jgi:alkaline phosphatase/predicted AlkP superfamily pyrophosphatase or phosphodiesterase